MKPDNLSSDRRQKNTNRFLRKLSALKLLTALSLIFALTACASWLPQVEFPWQSEETQPTRTPEPQLTETNALPAETQPLPTQIAPSNELVIWLPAEMDPTAENQAASLLNARLLAFSQAEGITISIRLKSLSGSGGLLDALTAASAAAPQALPDLILLPRRDLETAALKSMVIPLDPLTSIVDDKDWFPYAHEMSLIQGAAYGIPFVGDPLALILKAGVKSSQTADWQVINLPGSIFTFPADDTQALLPLTLYMALGGAVSGNQLRPSLDEEILGDTLTLLAEGQQKGSIRADVLQWQTFQQSWQGFLEGDANCTAAPVSLLLRRYAQAGTDAEALPSLLETSFTLSSGWVWALGASQAGRQELAVRLAEYLVEPGFLSSWSEAFGKLPARISALESWQNPELRAALMRLSLKAHFLPGNEILTSISPALRSAVLAVLRDNSSPEEAASQAVESLQ